MPSPESIEREPHLAHTREILHLAEQAAQGGMKALPGKSWALHYPEGGALRTETLNGLLRGEHEPADVAANLKPDAIIYDTADIGRLGLEGMTARIRELSLTAAHTDYEQFAMFVSSMQGKNVDLETLQTLYDGVSKNRTRGKLLDAYGSTGRQQIETSLKHEATQTVQSFDAVRGVDRVLEALKMQWIERRGISPISETSSVVDRLNKRERELFDRFSEPYNTYMDTGDTTSFDSLTQEIRDQIPAVEQLRDQMSPETEKLRDELQELMQDMPLPGTPGDPAIAPDDEDEYHTSEPGPGETMEKGPAASIFEITHAGKNKDALVGYYASGRKSYYDIATKTWSKRKQLTPYTTAVSGDDRYTISGRIQGNIKSLPIPAGYCLDASSMAWDGEKPELFRDQKGCFYVEPKGSCFFSVDFLKEQMPVGEAPIAEDLEPLTHQPFSSESEALLSSLGGSAKQQVEKIIRHVHGHHFYPGGGDLKMAQALQHKLRSESDGEEYVQKLEQSEYLECYSSNTLFIGLCRKAGIPARLVIGHKLDGARDGVAAITGSTGHAWSEFWDGSAWRRVDATPPVKPEDKKEEKEDENQPPPSPSSEANDGGIETPPEHDLSNEVRDRTQQQLENVKDQRMSEADEQDVSDGESELQKAKETMDQLQQEQRDLQRKIQEAKSFEKLEDLREEVKQSELFEDMKQSLEDMCDSKEKQMKEDMENRIDAMEEDGFIDSEAAEEIREQMKDASARELDELQKLIEREEKEHQEFENLREEVMPMVEHWYRYFAEHLPKESDIDVDDSSLARRGIANRKAMMRPSALLFGKVRNPRVFKPSIKPRFIASILVDVSESMENDGKIENARKLLVFYSELFSRISREFGYIRFSINTFSDSIKKIKGFDQQYDSRERYEYEDGESATVKVRLMRGVTSEGGTNMFDALKTTAADLNEQKQGYEDHVSALYLIGDGGDTCGNKENIRRFLNADTDEEMFGDHLKSATLLGTENDRRVLSDLFGDDHTNVAGDFEELVEKSMVTFADDIEDYCKDLAV